MLIAEIKTQSPFGFQSSIPKDELTELAINYGDIISVHIEKDWGGALSEIDRVRALTLKPILAKGFVCTPELIREVLNRGADFFLSVDVIPEIEVDKCFYEVQGSISPRDARSIEQCHSLVLNSRNLLHGGMQDKNILDANLDFYKKYLYCTKLCQASNIRSHSDLWPFANYHLVGSYLKDFLEDSGYAV